jgi:hypothetical protein
MGNDDTTKIDPNEKEEFGKIWNDKKSFFMAKIRHATPQSQGTQKNGMSLDDFARLVEMPYSKAERFLCDMQERGAALDVDDNNRIKTRAELRISKKTHHDVFEPKKIEVFGQEKLGYYIGIIGGTHFGSSEANLGVLRAAYKHFANLGITDVLHSGNVLAGKPPRGFLADYDNTDFEGQLGRFRKEYPRYKDITTHFISGHRDLQFVSKSHIDPGFEIASSREDFNNLGSLEADLLFHAEDKKPFNLRLYNEKLGFFYGNSYQAQRKIENMSGGDKPHILIIGGTQQMWQCRYMGVDVLKVTGVQNQTQKMRDRKYLCNVGFSTMQIVPTDHAPDVYSKLVPIVNPRKIQNEEAI